MTRLDRFPGIKPVIAAFSVDTGVKGDRLADDASVTLAGLAAPNVTVRLYADGVLLGTTISDESGNWRYVTPEVPDDTHGLVAETGSGRDRQASDPLVTSIDDTAAPGITPIMPDESGLHRISGAERERGIDIFRDDTLLATVTADAAAPVTTGAATATGEEGQGASFQKSAPSTSGGGNAVVLAATTGQQLAVTSSVTPTIFERRVASSADDVEQVAKGTMSLNSGDLELTTDGTKVQTVGIRFTGIDIPPGAIITNAYIQFTVDTVASGAVSLLIRGEDADDAGVFTTAPFNASSRPTTGASVAWLPPDWTIRGVGGLAHRTPAR